MHPRIALAAAAVLAVAVAGCGAPGQAAKPTRPAASAASAAHGLTAGAPLKGVAVPLPVLPKSSATSAVAVVPVDVASALQSAKTAPAQTPKTVQMPVPARLAGRFSAYRVGLPGGLTYLLGPKGMHGNGAIAADGSFHVTLTGPGRREMLHVWSDGRCASCSAESAGAFFASARRAAANYGGFRGQTLRQFGARLSHPDPDTAVFAYAVANGIEAQGFAYYTPPGGRGGLMFLSEVYFAPASLQGLTPWVLAVTRHRLG